MTLPFNLNDWVSTAQLKIWLALGALVIIGGAGSLLHERIPWSWAAFAAKELCPPLLTAGVLGLTVDTFLKREVARDVFVAAFRYVLPDELKEEARRIIDYRFLCTQSVTIIKLVPTDNELMSVHISHERVFRNITGHSEPFVGTFAVDEWGFPGTHSAIEELYLEAGGSRMPSNDNPDYQGKADAIGKKTGEVTIKSGATVRVVSRGYEIHRRNSELHMNFTHPSTGPVVRIELPEDFDHSCTFGIPDEKIIRSAISREHRLDGSQFPGQHTRIRWWPRPAQRTE